MESDVIEDALLDARAYISKVLGGHGKTQTDGPEALARIEEALTARRKEKETPHG